jgi:hypothetical protein
MRVSRKAPDSLTQNRKEAFPLPIGDCRLPIAVSIGDWGIVDFTGDWGLSID